MVSPRLFLRSRHRCTGFIELVRLVRRQRHLYEPLGDALCGTCGPASRKRTDIPFTAVITGYVDDFDWTAQTLYFHATYHDETSIPVNNDYNSPDNLDWNFTTITGRGVYCGDVLSLYNHCPDWYGEGDEKIWIDNDTFPSFMGTGTEDYYNCSWAPVVPFATPFGGAHRPMKHRRTDTIPLSEPAIWM